jgi:hypothetical protein
MLTGGRVPKIYKISVKESGCQPYTPAAFNPQRKPLVLSSVKAGVGSTVNDPIGNQTRDFQD